MSLRQNSSENGHFEPPSTPWLSCFYEAPTMISVTERQLSTEIMAYAPSKRHKYDYGRFAIRGLIADEERCRLDNRLGCDHELIDFAFLHELVTARSLREAILKLKEEHFHVIRVSNGRVDSFVDRYNTDSDNDRKSDRKSSSESVSETESDGKGYSEGSSKGNRRAKIKDDDESDDSVRYSPFPSTWL